MIQVEHLSKVFGNTTVVSEVSFQVGMGETLVLLGTSGSGKTTTLKMLNRLIEPTSGKIYINGNDIASQKPAELRRNMGYVIQQTGLFPHYTVEENIGVVPTILKWPAAKIKQRIYQLLEILGMPPAQFAKKYPHQLSGGQQQRAGLARALAVNPPIILMDEPFGALDPIIRHNIRQEFLQLDELKDKTTILVTHDVQEAVLLADSICLLDKGAVQQTGTPKELLLQPANTFVSQFFDQNRLQLELMVQTLDDIFPQLPIQATDAEKSLVFHVETSLWEVLSQLQQNKTAMPGVNIRKDTVLYSVAVDDIYEAVMRKIDGNKG